MPSETYGDRYVCVTVEINEQKPVRYDLAMLEDEDLEEELGEDSFFGFCVDTGMGCIADIKVQKAFQMYWEQRLEENNDIDLYHDLFCSLLEENAKKYPKYQREYGDWINWNIPETDCNLPIFSSGWGDGVYPCYFGYDAEGNVCGVYVHFIDIAVDYED